jgi:competence transcription factor ComK
MEDIKRANPFMMFRHSSKAGARLLYPDHLIVEAGLFPEEILDAWCLQCGSSLQGRIDSFREVTGSRVKTPVMISERKHLIYFPLDGMSHEDNVWISYQDLLGIRDLHYRSELTFIDGTTFILDCDHRRIRRQMHRCKEYISKLDFKCSTSIDQVGLKEVLCYE